MRAENTYHFFLICPVLAIPHATLFSRVFQILRNLPNQYVYSLLPNLHLELHQLLLLVNGSNLLLPDVNLQLFKVVAQHIVNGQWVDT